MEADKLISAAQVMINQLELDMAPIAGTSVAIPGTPHDPHPWLRGDFESYMRTLRGERELPHVPDGRCLDCRAMFDEQFNLVKRSCPATWLSDLSRFQYSSLEFVEKGLAHLRENGYGDA